MADNNQPNHTTTSDEMLARRRLLKLGVYVPPAVLGMMIVGGMPTLAQAVASCCPSACQPCINLGNNTNSKKCRKNWKKCRRKQRKLRKKGIHCPPIPYPCRHHGGRG